MKKLFVLSLLVCNIVLFSQKKQVQESDYYKPLNHVGLGLRMSTLGAGVEATTAVSKIVRVRAGISALPYSHEFNTPINDANVKDALGYDPDYEVKTKVNFVNGHVLIDLTPGDKLLHITAGVFVGDNRISARGRLVDPSTGNDAQLLPGKKWPDLNFEDYDIAINEGKVNADIIMGNKIKPYLGIGIGRSLPKKRLGFMFELGAIYQGKFRVEQDGKELPKTIQSDYSFDDLRDVTKYLEFWPMVNFQLTYRIN